MWLLSLSDKQLFKIIDVLNLIESNWIQTIMSEPELMHKIPDDDPHRPRLCVENIHRGLFHDKYDLCDPKVIKCLFEEEEKLLEK